ncbi:uncharacterized protein LOC127806938 [Diospyros lotus]|uniref:uncharacterized protein LOC127806938 n=1 Tax=Diospyros lotus TaxID=55363 RepID=UPI00224EB7B3|nr:uncharacterized protein LOC127806938 [Diospyros lotus]
MDTFVTKGKWSSSATGSGQTTLNQMLKRELREDCCQQIARFFYACAIPFNCVKHPEFAKMLELVGKFGSGLKPPSYHDIRVKYLKKEVTHITELLEEYKDEWKKTGCSIMSDGWTDKKRRSICNFLVNSPKGTVFLTSIDTSDFSKTADKVCEMLDAIVEKVGEENVVQVVTDNAANYKAAGEMLMEKRKRLYWTPCAAHCIDLILEDFEKKLKVHATTIRKARRISTYIYSRTLLISMLRQFTKGRDLIRPAVTRFATAYLTLGCLSELKGALMTMFTSNSWKSSRFVSQQDGRRVQQTVLDSRFWKNIIHCLKAALPLVKVLRLVDSDEKPAMGFIYVEMDRAKEKIKANFNNVKKNFEPILKIVDERWEFQLHRPLHAAAYYLNPHYHYSPNFKVNMEIKLGLFNCIERMVTDPEERDKIDVQIEMFKGAKGLLGIESAKRSRDKKAPAEWWDTYGDGCPELQRFAIRVLSLTCSSSGCERNWSAFEMVHTKRRNRLHQKKMNDLVFVMYNLKLRDRQSIKDEIFLSVDELSSDDEWITEESTHIDSSNGNDLDILNGATMMECGENEVGEDLESHGDEGCEDPFEPLGDFELEDDIDLEDDDDDGDNEDGHSLDLDEDLNISVNDLF